MERESAINQGNILDFASMELMRQLERISLQSSIYWRLGHCDGAQMVVK